MILLTALSTAQRAKQNADGTPVCIDAGKKHWNNSFIFLSSLVN
jgi:hypothetical protein